MYVYEFYVSMYIFVVSRVFYSTNSLVAVGFLAISWGSIGVTPPGPDPQFLTTRFESE